MTVLEGDEVERTLFKADSNRFSWKTYKMFLCKKQIKLINKKEHDENTKNSRKIRSSIQYRLTNQGKMFCISDGKDVVKTQMLNVADQFFPYLEEEIEESKQILQKIEHSFRDDTFKDDVLITVFKSILKNLNSIKNL